MNPVLVKVAFMRGVFEDSCRVPTRSELNYVSGFYDKIASAAYPFEKSASESIDFNEYLDSAHAIMCKEAVNWFGGGNWNPINWAASAGNAIDKGFNKTHDYLGDKIHQTGMFDGGGNVVTNALADYGNKGYQGILGDTLKAMGTVATLGYGGAALAGGRGVAAARGLAPRALSGIKNIASGAKNLVGKGLSKMKNWWRGGKGGQGATNAVANTAKGGSRLGNVAKWTGMNVVAPMALNMGISKLLSSGQQPAGGQQQAMAGAAGQGPVAQGQIQQGPRGAGMAGAAGAGSMGLGSAPTAPKNDARYSGFLNKFKLGAGAGGKGSFFK
jgi:hypothetical protein